jgi:two-component system, LytTR family, response regulator
MISSLIVDDEEKAIALLRKQLKRHCPEVEIVGEAQRIDEAIRLIELHHPRLIFLDIEMVGGSGFDLLERLKQRDFHVIFVTAYSEFAIKAFRFSVTDYLLKPVNRELLKQAVNKVKTLIDTSAPVSSIQTLRIPYSGGVAFVPIINIIRMSAEGPYTHIYLDSGKHYMTSHHLKQFEEHLDSGLFLRIHRSHLINRNKIKSIADKQALMIEMTDGAVIEVPRRSKQEILKILNFQKLS